MKIKPTIKDVAKKSGYSVSTVSLVVNKKPNVAKKAREEIQKVIDELGFHPQRSARGLASSASGNIGFIATNDHFTHAEAFYTKVFLGTEFEARKYHYYVLLTTVDYTMKETDEIPRSLRLEHNIDGVIIAGRYLKEAGITVPNDVAVVGFDNIEAALQVEPCLTTVNVHREELGSLAMRRIVEMI